MNDIAKKALFRRCADQCDTVEMMSRDMVGYQTEFEEFQRLHREIEDADLEDELFSFNEDLQRTKRNKELDSIYILKYGG